MRGPYNGHTNLLKYAVRCTPKRDRSLGGEESAATPPHTLVFIGTNILSAIDRCRCWWISAASPDEPETVTTRVVQ